MNKQIKITCSLRPPVIELFLCIVFYQGFASLLTCLAAFWRAHAQNSCSCLHPKIHCSLLREFQPPPGHHTRQISSRVLCSQGKKAPPKHVKFKTPRNSNFPSLGIMLSSWGDNFWTALHKFQKTSSWCPSESRGDNRLRKAVPQCQLSLSRAR